MKDYRVIELERCIIDGDFKTALLQLSDYFKKFESDLANDTLLYLGQWSSYERDVLQGIQTKNSPEIVRIQRAILSLKDELQSIFETSNSVETQAPAQVEPKKVDRFTYILEDNFKDNQNGWLEQLPEQVDNQVPVRFYFDKNQYFVEGMESDNGIYFTGILCVLEQDKDFKIETVIECLEIEETGYFGVFWGGNTEMSGFHSVSISSIGAVCVDTTDTTKETIFTTHLPWTEFAPVNQGTDTNMIVIENDKLKLKLSINNKLVHIQPFLPFFGNVVGFIVSNKTKFSPKNIRVGIA
ncbi:MAG: hypothetical protein JNL70_00090 [Saprospiraceae bacterium]|nr:hypothetical protein [Saprospiraceae bacterium]